MNAALRLRVVVPRPDPTGLILTGGGARAAYQVGVLRAVVRMLSEADLLQGNPFPIIAGTSAGAINGAALACGSDDIESAVEGLSSIWREFHANQVYRSDAWSVLGSGAKWLSMISEGWGGAKWGRSRPKSLLDNSPLADLLARAIPLERLPRLLHRGHMQALAVSASSYTSGQHVTFYEAARAVPPWERSQRIAVLAHLTREHLIASAAIPFIFPAVRLPLATDQSVSAHDEFFGDGSMRQAAPISPAIHLGAQRVLVIGAGRMHEPVNRPQPQAVPVEYPNLAQIAGHALSNIFLDALAVDIERLQRVNHTLSLLDAQATKGTSLRPVDVLVIAPSQRLDDIAARHLRQLPRAIRTMLRAVGVSGRGKTARGAALASYLLFEPPYTQELMALGEKDALAKQEEVLRFFGGGDFIQAVDSATTRGMPKSKINVNQ